MVVMYIVTVILWYSGGAVQSHCCAVAVWYSHCTRGSALQW